MATATRQVELRSQLPDVPFVCAQINPSAIIEGKPETRCALLSRSRDNSLSTMAWDCTAGRFYWYYNEDESIVVVAGDARISIDGGPEQVVGIGDTIYFPSGSVALWQVDAYVRKVAFLRKPMPKSLSFFLRAAWRVRLMVLPLHRGVGSTSLG